MLRRDMTTDGTAPAVALAPLLTRFRDQLGWISLLAFAASAWLSTTVAHICLALLAAMTLAQGPATWRRLSRDPFVRLCGLFLIYLTASAAWAAHQRPESAADQWNALWPWASLWLFFVVGWWLEGNWRRVAVVLTVAPLGLILSVARRTDWQQLPTWMSGARYEFGYSALGLSFLCVVMVLGLIAFLPRLAHSAEPGLVVRLRVWAAVGALLFFLFILLVAQSRGAWLSLGLGLIGLAVAGLGSRRRAKPGTRPNHKRPLLLPAVLCIAALGGLWNLFGDALETRFASEANVLPQVMAMDMERLPYSNGPARIHLAVWGVRMAAERPLFGWGPGMRTTAYLGEHGFHGSPSKFLRVVRHFEHLHDVYIEILVRFGLVGAAFFLAAFVLFSRTLLSLWKLRILPDDFFAFAAVVIVATLVSGLYEFRTLHIDFRFFSLLFGGAVYTFALHRPVAPEDAATGTAHPTPRGVP